MIDFFPHFETWNIGHFEMWNSDTAHRGVFYLKVILQRKLIYSLFSIITFLLFFISLVKQEKFPSVFVNFWLGFALSRTPVFILFYTPNHQSVIFLFCQKYPLFLSESSSANQTGVSAPSSTLLTAFSPPIRVFTHPGHTEAKNKSFGFPDPASSLV